MNLFDFDIFLVLMLRSVLIIIFWELELFKLGFLLEILSLKVSFFGKEVEV